MEEWPAWACTASRAMPASRSRVMHVWRSSWQVAWARPLSRRRQDLVQSGGGERPPAVRPLEHDEDTVGGRVRRPLVIEVGGHAGEEARRHRDEPLVAALALDDEHLALATRTSSRRSASTSQRRSPEHHSIDHGPVPGGAQGADERVHLGRLQDAGQQPGSAHEHTRRNAGFPLRRNGGQSRFYALGCILLGIVIQLLERC